MSPVFDDNGHATTAGDLRVYYFDPLTREFIGFSDEYIYEGVSIPGNSTITEPGANKKGKVQVYTGSAWEQKEDHRGELSYSTENLHSKYIDYIGAVQDGYTLKAPSTIFDKWDGSKWVTDTDAQSAAQMAEINILKQSLISEATNMIATFQQAKDDGYIDDADLPKLEAWQKYRYALTKVDSNNQVWPEKPE